MDPRETGQDTKFIVDGQEYGVQNVEDNAGEATYSDAENNLRPEPYRAFAGVEHGVTVTIDGSAQEVDEAFYDDNYHPKQNVPCRLIGSEYGTEYRESKATSRPRTVPARDGTNIEIDIIADQANRV